MWHLLHKIPIALHIKVLDHSDLSKAVQKSETEYTQVVIEISISILDDQNQLIAMTLIFLFTRYALALPPYYHRI